MCIEATSRETYLTEKELKDFDKQQEKAKQKVPKKSGL